VVSGGATTTDDARGSSCSTIDAGVGGSAACAPYARAKHDIAIAPNVTVPVEALHVAFTRASGPGGQNVNRVSSKVRVRVEVEKIIGLDDDARARLRHLAGHRLDADGNVMIVSQKTPDQPRNVEDALEKVRELVLEALVEKAERLGSTETYAAVQKRIDDKKATAHRKEERAKVDIDLEDTLPLRG
jgi:ribosome-associated protein